MHLSFTSALAWVNAFGIGSAGQDEGNGVKNVAIIGAGAAGSSAAYHLQKYADEENLAINITIFEKTDHVGGRTLTVNALDDPQYPTELGASIFVTINHILYDASRDFGLALGGMIETASADEVTAIWDGERFAYETTSGSSWWWDATKMFWKYGSSPYYAVKLVKGVVGDFLKLYDAPYFPFRSLTQRAYELGLQRVTAVTGEQFLADNKINADFSREIIQAATRVNYASNLAHIHGLETMVSFSTDGAVAVVGGNWQIFQKMVERSAAALYRNTTISAIEFDKRSSTSQPKYLLSTKASGSEAASAEPFPVSFDNVIIASPWQYSNISASQDIIRHHIDEIPYTKLHVTLFSSPFKLRPGFFGLEPGARAPSNVYTTLRKGEEAKRGADGVGITGFYSISTLKTVVNPKTQGREFLYKVFSPAPVTSGWLTDLLGAEVPSTFVRADDDAGEKAAVDPISWYYPHWFYSYPIELPRVTFQDPVVGNGVYYTSGIESFISTMETSALMGMNVARLIADDFAGITREEEGRDGNAEADKGFESNEL